MFSRLRNSRRTAWFAGLLLALYSARALVPVGYMPAPFSEGGIVLCHDASAPTLSLLGIAAGGAAHGHAPDGQEPAGHADHAGHHATPQTPEPGPGPDAGDSPVGHDTWERCALGISGAAYALAFDVRGRDGADLRPDIFREHAQLDGNTDRAHQLLDVSLGIRNAASARI